MLLFLFIHESHVSLFTSAYPCDTDYVDGVCYWVHPAIGRKYKDALLKCEGDFGSLASIKSETISQLVRYEAVNYRCRAIHQYLKLFWQSQNLVVNLG